MTCLPRTLPPELERSLRAAHCTAVPADQPGCHIELCSNASHGFVAVTFDDGGPRSMLLRIGGPHPQTSLFRASAFGQAFVAPFRLCETGEYTAHVRQLTHNSSDAFTAAVRTSKTRRVCALHHRPRGIVLQRHAWMGRGGSVPCNQCLWGWHGGYPSTAAYGSLANLTLAPHPWSASLDLNFSALQHAHPSRHATLYREAIDERRNRRAGRPLCLVGDSHLRNLNNRLVSMTHGADVCNIFKAQRDHVTCTLRGSAFRYFELHNEHSLTPSTQPSTPYSRRAAPFSPTRMRRHNCSAVVANLGHWLLGYTALHPLEISQYRETLDRVLERLTTMARGAPVALTAMNPHPLNGGGPRFATFPGNLHDQTRCPLKDQRLPHAIDAYNAVAAERARAHGMPFLDSWQAALDLLDLSFDMRHYHDPVALATTVPILSWWDSVD